MSNAKKVIQSTLPILIQGETGSGKGVLANWLHRRALETPDRPALFLGTREVADYGAFRDRVAELAGWLVAQGVASGDRVAIFMKNCPDYLVAQQAIWWCGAAAVPINAKLHGREAAFIIENSGAAIDSCRLSISISSSSILAGKSSSSR